MAGAGIRGPRGLVPLLLVSGVVVLVAVGQARGLWLSNLHNGLLALAFTSVGAYVLYQRPGHPEGRLFLLTGVVEAVLFLGRQIGHSSASDAGRWWGWLGVWPTAVALGLTTLAVVCFPDGRLPSARWRWAAAAIAAVTVACAVVSAVWPVEYGSAGVTTAHPVSATAPAAVSTLWSAVAHPAYVVLQLLWVLAVITRWRASTPTARGPLVLLVVAAAVSVAVLAAGLAVGGTPVPGLLAVPLVPVAAGWAIVHGQHTAAYSALSWLSRARDRPVDLPTDLVRAVSEALAAPGAVLWMGSAELHAVGVWPEVDSSVDPTTVAALQDSPDHHVRVVRNREAAVVGAVSLARRRADHLSLAESRLFDDLASHASLILDHIGLADVIARERRAGHLDGLSPRERQVLELMARGLSNAAICAELHLSIKTVEPVVSAVFSKLGLHADAASNRRVLAVLAYLRS